MSRPLGPHQHRVGVPPPPDRHSYSYDFVTDNEARSVSGARRTLRNLGWARTRVVEITRQRATTPGYTNITVIIEATGIRGVDPDAASLASRSDWARSRSFKPGMRVRSRAEGLNFAGGQRHVMPVGASGVVSSRQGINIRVRFAELPGRTFMYSPDDLVVREDDVP